MSTYYPIYAEAYVNNKWVLMNPQMYNIESGEYKVALIANPCGSYFGEAWNKIRELGSPVKRNEVSDGLKLILDEYPDDDPCIQIEPWSISADELKVDGFAHAGYVSHEQLNAFKNGEVEAIYPVEMEDVIECGISGPAGEIFDRLFKFHEWNNPDDWQSVFTWLYEKVNVLTEIFMDENGLWEKPPVRIITYWN